MRVGHRCRWLRAVAAPPADTGEEPIGSCAPQLDHQRAVRLFHLTVPCLDRVRQPSSQDAVLHASGFELFHRLVEPFEPLRQGLDRGDAELVVGGQVRLVARDKLAIAGIFLVEGAATS